jgi:hypothetical protein
MKRSFLITITIVLVFLITGCATNTGTKIIYEDETYLQLSNGTMKIKADEPILEEGTDENGVSYLRVQGSNKSITCSCDGSSGSCKKEKAPGSNLYRCKSVQCSIGCSGSIKLAPASVKWTPYHKDKGGK